MDYKIMGIYSEKKESLFNGGLLHTYGGKKYEIVEFPVKHTYAIKGSAVVVKDTLFPLKAGHQKIVYTGLLLFICYRRTLEIFNFDGRLLKTMESRETIGPGRNGFMMVGKTPFIANLEAQSIFIPDISGIIEFTRDGKVFAISESESGAEEKTANEIISGAILEGIQAETEVVGSETEVVGSEKEVVGSEKEVVGSEKEVVGSEKEVAAVSKEVTPSDSIAAATADRQMSTITADISPKPAGRVPQVTTAIQHSNGWFLSQTLGERIVYDTDGEVLLELLHYKVFRGTAKISGVLCCASINLETFPPESNDTSVRESSDCVVVLCTGFVYLILGDLVIRKPVSPAFTHIIPERFVVHNYVDECSIYGCVLLINCFRQTVLFKASEIEGFLVSLLNSKQDTKFAEAFFRALRLNSKMIAEEHKDFLTILCRVYRQVEETPRRLIERFVDFDELDADHMFYIIISRPDLVRRFIALCKEQKRLFYLRELKSFFVKTGRADECKRMFLENGLLLFEYSGLETFYEIEKREIESQRLVYLCEHKAKLMNRR